jgi:sodium/potassium-transporting ATPase subunit alpha
MATNGDGYLDVGGADGDLQTRTTSYMTATGGANKQPEPPAPVEAQAPVKKTASKSSLSRKNSKSDQQADISSAKIDIDEQTQTVEAVATKYTTSTENGLTTEEADIRLARDGKNELTPPVETPWYIMLLKEMVGGFATLLWIASIMCFVAYIIESNTLDDVPVDNLALGIVLAAVVIVTGLFSYTQTAKSSNVMKKFRGMVPKKCMVLRDGKWNGEFDPTNLVLGDIVQVNNGDKVSADMRMFESDACKVEMSSLTGEPIAIKRETAPEENPNPLEAKNLAFFTTQILNGKGRGIVIRTGDSTVIGQIKDLVTKTANKRTPINIEIEHFIHLITGVAIFLGVTFFVLSLAIGHEFLRAAVFLIAIIVANVPEGLLATVTVCLTLTAQRMAKKFVLVKNLESVETLGSTSCICSDKTGTLTQNKMTAAHVYYNMKVARVLDTMADDIVDPGNEQAFDLADENFKQLWFAGQLCNTTTYNFQHEDCNTETPFQERLANGDASETAMLKFCDIAAVDKNKELKDESYGYSEDFRPANVKKMNIPFNSKVKFSGSVHKPADGRNDGAFVYLMKGAPERIMKKCNRIFKDGAIVEMTEEIAAEVDRGMTKLANQGERVLGYAMKNLDRTAYPDDFVFDDDEPYNGLPDSTDMVFVGLMALIDPPRPAVPKAVRDCQTGGIQVIMVTGDHAATAKAIAKNIGIIKDNTAEDNYEESNPGSKFTELPEDEQWTMHDAALAQVCTGDQLTSLTDKRIDQILQHNQIVFARTSPAQKLQIVQAVQRNGKIVAVTGDGVNDSPALKAANIGVAMGIAGSDVSKEAADMILLNDDFASIVNGVEEGRLVFDNLKKSIAYTLTSNIPEISPFLIYLTAAIPSPLSTVMILAIDLGTDMYPAISMAYETAESDIMLRRPRNPKEDALVTVKLLSYTYLQIGIIQALAGFFCYFVVFSDSGFLPANLFGLRDDFEDKDLNALKDDYGNEWTYESRLVVQQCAQTSYFTSIVIVQWADLIICKTRILSLFQQGMLKNPTMIQGLFFESCLAVFISYCPGIHVGLKTRPLSGTWWLPAVTFSFLIWIYDEIRKYLMREYRKAHNGEPGFVERSTYY